MEESEREILSQTASPGKRKLEGQEDDVSKKQRLSASSDTATAKSATNSIKDTASDTRIQCNNNAEICATLTEARDSLLSCLSDANKTHYVVCIPNLSQAITILTDFKDVLKLMKEHKSQSPRMFSFPTLAEAEAFANKHTADEVCQGTANSSYPQEKAEVEVSEGKLFPSLTTPQLNEFRIYLEKGNISAAKQCILTNPRYLVQNIDMPTILKEGARYNALHASVIANQLESCQLVMEMISDVNYLARVFNSKKRADRSSKRLIDLYLNTPDKVANKTPLHFASERGFVEIVAFLVSFKACIRNFNRHIIETVKQGDEQTQQVLVTGETPEEVACSRYNGPNAASLKAKIVSLIQGGTCYVPLIRSDTTGPYAKVGDPYTPSSPYKLVSEIEDVFRPAPATNLDFSTKDFSNMKVWAFAGPMSPREAADFRKKWKSPTLAKLNHSVRENHKILDGDRGFERFGRELADCHSTSWQEYWPFLDAFADLRSEEGLHQLDLFFQKQEVIHFVQALLRGENFVPAEQYTVSPEYILDQVLSELEESDDDDMDGYFSAEDDSSGMTAETRNGASNGNAANSPRGVFSSLLGGVLKLINIITPKFRRHRQNVNSLSAASVTNAEEEESPQFSVPGVESPASSCNSDMEGVSCESNSTVVTFQPEDIAQSQEAALSSANGDTPLHVQISDLRNSGFQCQEHVENITKNLLSVTEGLTSVTEDLTSVTEDLTSVTEDLPSNTEDLPSNTEDLPSNTEDLPSVTEDLPSEEQVTEKADMDMCQTPEKWKYRTLGQSPDSPSPGKAFSDHLSSSCSDQDEMSPVCSQPRDVHRLNLVDSLDSPQGRTPSSSQPGSCQVHLDDSFNTKMNTFSNTLEKFTILSPTASPSVSATNTPSAPSNILTEEPCVHIFTGKMFSKFVSELKSRKYTGASKVIPEDPSELPIVFVRQGQENTILADIFLPAAQTAEESWLKSRGHIMDELTHKEVIKNVWVNFLVVFPTSEGANRILSLSEDVIVCAVVEGVQDDRDAYSISSYGKPDSESLTHLFFKSKNSLMDSKNAFTLCVRIARSATLHARDVFICGTIPTKVDADVYHTLNSRACELIYGQPSRFSRVLQWYEKMSKQGTDSISRLPSPSRVLRSERREPPPPSPLASTPVRPLRQPGPAGSTSTGQAQSDSVVRNLFSS